MTDSTSSLVIAVSGLHRGESPQPGGAVIESIRASLPQARFVGISYDLVESGVHAVGPDRVDAAYLFPYPGAGPQAFLDRLRAVHAQEHISLLVPTLDSELDNLVALRPQLAQMGIEVIVPTAGALAARSKPQLGELGQQAGISVPQTFAAHSAAALAAQARLIGYPCYVKGAMYDARLARNEAELYAAFNSIFGVWGGPVLLQQAVYGEEYVVAGLGDGEGGVIAQCALRKLLRTKMGKAFGGVVIEDETLTADVERLIGALKWKGPFEIEFVQTALAGRFLFEINPRFPAWISFPAKVGCNMPAWAAREALGMELPALAPCAAGKMFLRHCEDIVTDMSEIADMSIDGTLAARPARNAPEGQDARKGQGAPVAPATISARAAGATNKPGVRHEG